MSTISLKQKKEWANTDLVLLTPRGVKYYPREKEKIGDHIVVEGPGNYHCGYSFSAEEGYLSYKRYFLPRAWKVADWKKVIANNKAVLSYSSVMGGYYQEFITDSEIRIYPDCKFIVLLQGHKDKILEHVVLDNINKEEITEDIITVTPIDWQKTSFYTSNHYIYLESEEDIQKNLHTLRATDASKFANTFFSRADSDLNKKIIENPNAYGTLYWNWYSDHQVQRILKPEEHKYKCTYMAKKTGSSLQMAFDIPFYISAPDAPAAAAANKEERAEMLIEPVREEWEHGDPKKMYWYRHEDYVCVIAPGTISRSGYGYDSEEKKLLAYNVKTKKRLYGVKDRRGTWTFPIPSSKYINEAMATVLDKDAATSGSGYYSRGTRGATSSVIKGTLTVRELFDGTNVAWFLDHAEDDKVYFQNVSIYDYSEEECKYNTTPTKQLFRKDYIDTLAIIMLCTTGTPLLEQFLKSSLFNLYFTGIEDLMGDRCCFITKTKYEKNSYINSTSFVYDEKGKNLKQMFGVPMNFLRLLDKAKEIQKHTETSTRYDKEKTITVYERPNFNLGQLKNTFGDSFNSLDQTTMELILTISNEEQVKKTVAAEKSSRYLAMYNSALWAEAKTVFDILPDCNIRQKLLWLQKYQPTLHIFSDYLRMRKTVQDIQKLTPEMPWIFSDRMYPIKIGPAKKFIPYTESERRKCEASRRGYYYSSKRTSADVHPQVEYYNQKYFLDYYSTSWSPNVIECFDEDGNHSGVVLTLNPAAHLDYLHEQITFWFNFYKDAKQNKLFQEAVKRVKSLEWADKTSGLEIVAPTCVEDLQQEGIELSHCVSSFVQPIIDGSTNVVFVRRSDMKSTPYYTVEVVKGAIRQVHCYRNGGLDEAEQKRAFANSGSPVYDKIFDIVGFLKRWARNSEGAINENSVKGSYSAMVAAR